MQFERVGCDIIGTQECTSHDIEDIVKLNGHDTQGISTLMSKLKKKINAKYRRMNLNI